MPLPKIDDARTLSDQELADEILAAKRELFELRLQQATRRLEKPHQFKHLKHRIAQMMTIARERQLAALSEETSQSVSDSATTQPAQAEAEEAVKADEQESVSEQTTEVTPESSPSEENKEE
ncbi:MAG: 50S ribosomal protein L29 [Coleofasciculus sp. B1-GNL1-01]|uniref:50S ribosomal protein L29 n=1 Tax=Coleofasciculus sp. B1-GNL1-01 TaxID=3068484 RepID=UPI0032FF4790